MKTALIVGHPDLGTSRVNAALVAAAHRVTGLDVRSLSELYPDGVIDVVAEQAALASADRIVLLYPTYWYSTPALLKRWLDDVLLRGWAYGTGGAGALAGKTLGVVTTTGGSALGYRPGELHSYEYDAILAPLRATAHRLGMRWGRPLVIHGVRELDEEALADLASHVEDVLGGFAEPSHRWAAVDRGAGALA